MQSGPRRSDPLLPRSKYLAALAAATLVVGLLEATDVIDLPFGVWFSGMTGSAVSTSSLREFMSMYGYVSLFILMGMESASLPVPSEVVLPFAGYLVYLGAMNFWAAVAVSTAAGIAGALLDYFLAVWLGRPFVARLLKAVGLHSGALDRAERWFDRSGQWTVFAARFIPGLRTAISLPAGLFRMKLRPFAIMTLAGCFLWNVVLIYAGFIAGRAWSGAFASSSTVIDALSGIVAVISGAYIAYYAYWRISGTWN